MILGAVLAGGEARRFGADKALAVLNDRSLIDHVIEALTSHVDGMVICGRDWPDHVSLADRPAPGLGPLGGLAAALAYGLEQGFEKVLCLPCDTPILDRQMLRQLSEQPGAAFVAGCPVIGIWPTNLSATLDLRLAVGGDRSLRGWARQVDARLLAVEPPPNVNERVDLERLRG